MASIRESYETYQNSMLSPYAQKVTETRGRMREESEDDLRTAYQRDRDRIIHCNAFRRLQHKTQVFLSPTGDHYRTRLTHTLEVTQIARTMARALNLNEDLIEAICLGHDLGHTPFGHAGERALNAVYPDGFRHFEQSLRVVDRLEKEGRGLNLTYEVRDGILCHTRGKEADTLEGRLVKYADKFAYLNHDIDDAIRAGLFTEEDLPRNVRETLGTSKSQRIDTLVRDMIAHTNEEVGMSESIQIAYEQLTKFMFDCCYTNPICKGEEGKAEAIVQEMYRYFSEHPTEMPNDYVMISMTEGPERAACDYISGMSDRYALAVFENLFIPKPWAE